MFFDKYASNRSIRLFIYILLSRTPYIENSTVRFMDQVLLILILLVIFGAHFYITYRQQTWSRAFKFAYTVTLVVPPMSHLWHILYGEDRITCDGVNRDAAFGWTPCFEFTWNNIVNTYEITLTIENIFFAALTYYVLFNLRLQNLGIAVALNTALLVLVLILLFASPAFLDGYEGTYDWSGFIVSIILWLFIERELRNGVYSKLVTT